MMDLNGSNMGRKLEKATQIQGDIVSLYLSCIYLIIIIRDIFKNNRFPKCSIIHNMQFIQVRKINIR